MRGVLPPFLDPRPLGPHPALDTPLVSLPCAPFRHLAGPAESLEDVPDVAGMVRDVRRGADEPSDAGERPDIGRVPVGAGATRERTEHALPSCGGELRLRAGRPLRGERTEPARSPGDLPLGDRRGGDVEPTGNLGIPDPSPEERRSAPSSAFEGYAIPFPRPWRRMDGHTPPWYQNEGRCANLIHESQ